ncbi:MAG: hypothetical protein O3A51_02985, partial [Verrucomicrobia bacterium]|nr:hypothetical protein [Verrucomicrobiota bacterium]
APKSQPVPDRAKLKVATPERSVAKPTAVPAPAVVAKAVAPATAATAETLAAKPSPARKKKKAKKISGPAAAAPVIVKRRPAPTSFGVGAVNLILGVVVVVFLALTGYEIYANMRADAAERTAVPVNLAPVDPLGAAQTTLPPLDDILRAFEVRPIFESIPEPQKPGPQAPIRVPYPEQNCRLLGISEIGDSGEFEAIIMDNQQNKMHFLKVGDSLPAEGESYTVESIQSDRVIFYDGQRRSQVE